VEAAAVVTAGITAAEVPEVAGVTVAVVAEVQSEVIGGLQTRVQTITYRTRT
jgi:hypothetical protein